MCQSLAKVYRSRNKGPAKNRPAPVKPTIGQDGVGSGCVKPTTLIVLAPHHTIWMVKRGLSKLSNCGGPCRRILEADSPRAKASVSAATDPGLYCSPTDSSLIRGRIYPRFMRDHCRFFGPTPGQTRQSSQWSLFLAVRLDAAIEMGRRLM